MHIEQIMTPIAIKLDGVHTGEVKRGINRSTIESFRDIKEMIFLQAIYEICIILPSNDYNTYYNLTDGKVYNKFKDIKKIRG